jgi:O-succinylbenzoic acid--CoA ligase
MIVNIHKSFKLNSKNYNKEELISFAYKNIENNNTNSIYLSEFILELFNINTFILCKTSGSTGKPKNIKLEKKALVNSTYMTRDYFNLTPGLSAISFLPMNFIAGKMMLVRAMVLGLDLHLFAPTSNPSKFIDKKYCFSAMTPMQASNSINKLKYINTLILGGSNTSKELSLKILSKKVKYYETYGMTETATHIAIKKVSKQDVSNNSFRVLKGVTITANKNNCLVIEAPHICVNKLITNDVVEIISNSQFCFIGRKDNVINSGGVKLVPEKIEYKLSRFIAEKFIISSVKDELLGSKVVLIIESKKYKLKEDIFKCLDKFEIPKKIYFIDNFSYTSTNKIDRLKTTKKSYK